MYLKLKFLNLCFW